MGSGRRRSDRALRTARWRSRGGQPIESSGMCRNITTLRGLDPPATPEEIEA
ncbi:MAG: DUF2277 domain-containing protein, partial [Acidimicrobiia bacterium]|nr:DUF2277 domain-containing protein [Acidimicrobiia bacterium]